MRSNGLDVEGRRISLWNFWTELNVDMGRFVDKRDFADGWLGYKLLRYSFLSHFYKKF
jgi:hypothetical protein